MSEPTLGPNFLHAEDLIVDGKWAERSFEIESVHRPGSVKGGDGKIISKPVIKFVGGQGLVLGGITARMLKRACGNYDPREWVGQEITLYPVTGNWFNGKKTGMRIRLPGDVPFNADAKDLGEDITGRSVSEVD